MKIMWNECIVQKEYKIIVLDLIWSFVNNTCMLSRYVTKTEN